MTSVLRCSALCCCISCGVLLHDLSFGLGASLAQVQTTTPLKQSALREPVFNRSAYNPAVLHVRFTEAVDRTLDSAADAFLDLTLIPASGKVEGLRVELSKSVFLQKLRGLYRQLSRQESLQVDDPSSPSRQLHALLIEGITPILEREKITTILLAADRGLQAVPFAALSDGQRFFGDRYAFAITPSLALTEFNAANNPDQRLLAFGASEFQGLSDLPLVPQELNRISAAAGKDQFLNREFTASALIEKAGLSRYDQLHVATHAEFKPGGPQASQLHSGAGPISMSELASLRQKRQGIPLDLVVFSACRTALGDAEAELGFSGLALQAGARSAIGTLWYVDDVATSAYFVQMYRFLADGIPKAEAMQMTRQAFVRGLVRLDGNQVLGVGDVALLSDLNPLQQRRAAAGFSNPFFWGGIELMGAPW
ncbi:CHAT domain-containing protein [Synechococcus sp. MIT S1220]|uniref:CHAT domain-containing protein n=1 Tax=Synechococcus sp. MIT S1220 TaxID=3082549 RepID=UPI0039B1211B